MSEPTQASLLAQSPADEATTAVVRTALDLLASLAPPTRLRILAFLHRVDRPGAVAAELAVDPSGTLRLTLNLPTRSEVSA